MDKRVVLIGTGNVAWSLAPAIQRATGFNLVQIYGRRLDRARQITDTLLIPVEAVDSVDGINPHADIYIVSLKDDASAHIITEIANHNKDLVTHNTALWLHTSGGVGMEALASMSPNYGVLYPLQTFSHGRTLPFDKIPIFIDASNFQALALTKQLANALSSSVTHADSATRRLMHVAAVFACNFTNHLWAVSQDILEQNNLDFSLLRPLLLETMNKAFTLGPAASQTGPASRGDQTVMKAHHGALSDEHYRELYTILSESIMRNAPNVSPIKK